MTSERGQTTRVSPFDSKQLYCIGDFLQNFVWPITHTKNTFSIFISKLGQQSTSSNNRDYSVRNANIWNCDADCYIIVFQGGGGRTERYTGGWTSTGLAGDRAARKGVSRMLVRVLREDMTNAFAHLLFAVHQNCRPNDGKKILQSTFYMGSYYLLRQVDLLYLLWGFDWEQF